MHSKNQGKKISRSTLLIALCWLAYACSYIGKLSYNANINPIREAYGISYADAGTVSTFFFFVYGIGQVVNGIMCKKYSIKPVVFTSLIVASAMNFLMVTVGDFSVMKYLWLVNGAAMSFLWTSLIRLLSETLPTRDIGKSVIAMGTTVATGTFIVYGLSAVFTATVGFKATFYIAAAIMTAVAFVWIFSFDGLVKPLREERAMEAVASQIGGEEKKKGGLGALGMLLAVLAFFSVSDNLAKDGLTSWTPSILKSLYETPDWLSILLTLLLPVMAALGAMVAVRIQRLTGNFVTTCTLLFGASALMIGVVIIFISTSQIVLTVACFAIVSCLMSAVNNVVTSMVPLNMKDKVNSGLLAGVLNGFCYLGSTVSSYGLGSVADELGWLAVFYVLLGVIGLCAAVGITYNVINGLKKKGA